MSTILSPYYHPDANHSMTKGLMHREAVGGLWDELGVLQFDFLLSKGLEAHHKVLDLG
jgi:hypothetical protein